MLADIEKAKEEAEDVVSAGNSLHGVETPSSQMLLSFSLSR